MFFSSGKILPDFDLEFTFSILCLKIRAKIRAELPKGYISRNFFTYGFS
jgi:hypothetical protein